MVKFKTLLLAGGLALLTAVGIAYAGGVYTPGFPQAGSVANTLPLTGNELIPADTQLPFGLAPQTESISVNQLIGAAAGNATYASNAATTAATVTAAQIAGGGNLHVMDMTGTLAGSAALTTPTAAQIIAVLPNFQVGDSYILRVINRTAATQAWTLTGGSNVTVNGTATIAAAAWADWIVTLNQTLATPTVVITSVGRGTN